MHEYEIDDIELIERLAVSTGHDGDVDAEVIAITTTVLYTLPKGTDEIFFVPADALGSVCTGDTIRLLSA